MTSEARISVSLREGNIEIEGTESFVVAQVARFEALITAALQKVVPKTAAAGGGAGKEKEPGEGAGSLDEFPNLFAIADGKVQITKSLPGVRKAQKMVSAATLLAFGNSLRGTDWTSFDEIRDLCSTHGCLDGPNFAKTIRAERSTFIIEGSGKSRRLKLNVPGRAKALALAKQLNAA